VGLKPWVVYAKKPFASPDHVLDYLGRYTHRVALSNNRICSVHNSEVTFTYRDRKNQNQLKLMKLQAHEFIRRFLLHVIPKGLMRVRHFGFLANRSKERLSTCRQLLGLLPALPIPPQRSTTHELMLALTGIDLTRCPRCQNGTLSSLPNYLSCHHRTLRDDRSTIQLASLPGALRHSQRIGAPCFVTSRLLSPPSLASRALVAVSHQIQYRLVVS
jgi:hypothetical protein